MLQSSSCGTQNEKNIYDIFFKGQFKTKSEKKKYIYQEFVCKPNGKLGDIAKIERLRGIL